MATKKTIKKVDEFTRLSDNFRDEMSALIVDFYEITQVKTQTISKIIKQSSSSDPNNLPIEDYIEFVEENTKHHQFRYAMFNFMNSIFEKHINDLFKISIINNPKIKERYITKFIELDKLRVESKQSSIRNTDYETTTSAKKLNIQLKYIKEISSLLPPLHNWQFFYDISDTEMWANEDLKFDFTEMKSRRNLLTHRGTVYDEDYVESIINSVKKSKKISDPQKRVEEYHKLKYFTFISQKQKTLHDLIGKNSTYKVRISNSYFTHCFITLINIYFTVWNNATKSNNLCINLSHELLELGKKLKNPTFYFVAKSICYRYIRNYLIETIDNDFVKANYLLATREVNKINAKLGREITQSKFEKEFIDYFLAKNEPIYNLLLSLLNNNYDDCLELLKKVNGLKEQSRNWFIFSDLLDYKNFNEIFSLVVEK